MSRTCKRCGSHAINEHMHGRKPGINLDLCDVCYWRNLAEAVKQSAEVWTNETGTNDLRAAVDRLRDIFNANRIDWENAPLAAWADMDTVVRFCLAEHPVDDDEPVTEEWLFLAGFHKGEHFIWGIDNDEFENAINGHFWSNPPVNFLMRAGDVTATDRATRGDVRRLCKALGVELKEGHNG